MAEFDSNTWYQIVNVLQGDGSGLQVGFPSTYPYGSVYGSPFNTDNNYQYWQIIPNEVDLSGWLMRARSTGPGLFMAANNGKVCTTNKDSCEDTLVRVQPQLEDTTVFHIEPWDSDNSSFYIYPKANGSDYRMDLEWNGSWLWFNKNAASDNSDASKWTFTGLGSINDPAWSTVAETASYTQTMTTGPQSATTSGPAFTVTPHAAGDGIPSGNSQKDNSGLSTGAQAAIGAAVGGFVVIALIVFGCWFLRRRRKRQDNETPDLGYDYTVVEKESAPIVEAPNHESNAPVELDASRGYYGGYKEEDTALNDQKYVAGYADTAYISDAQKYNYQQSYT